MVNAIDRSHFHTEATEMKVWILTAVLAVALIGGAALAVASDGDADSDGTVVVDIDIDIDIGDVLVAPTHDAVTAYQQAQHSLVDKASGVPVFVNVFANATLNEHDDCKHRRTKHTGKPMITGHRANCDVCHVRLAVLPHAHPLRC